MFQLRSEQIKFKQEIGKAFAAGNRTVLGVMATGGGKSVIAADMAAGAIAKGLRVLVLTGRRQIVFQLTEHCQRAGIQTGIIMGSIERAEDAPVQVASIQTLLSRGFSMAGNPDFIIVDEAHNYFATTKKILNEVWPTARALGFTATPCGPGGSRLGHFSTMVEPVKNSELIAAGHLLRVHPYLAPSEPEMTGINLKTASRDEIGQRVQECTIYGHVFDIWRPYAHLQTLVVLPSRAVCQGFLLECERRGITARVVDGTTPQEERDETFSEFKETDCQMILGVDVISEGLDLPIAQCLIDLHPTHQMRRFWQTIGRIKRPHPGQESAVVIDLAGNLWRHMIHPDQNPPWDELTNDTTIEEVIERKAGVRCPKCGSKDIYSIKDLGYKCEDCKHEWAPKRPWVCPMCKQGLAPYQKVIGGKCPNCGEKVNLKPVRRVRMIDGSLRVFSANEIKRRKKSKADGKQAAWDKARYVAHHAGKTLNFARWLYKQQTGEWPNGQLKDCPDSANSGDWARRPAEVYPWMKTKAK